MYAKLSSNKTGSAGLAMSEDNQTSNYLISAETELALPSWEIGATSENAENQSVGSMRANASVFAMPITVTGSSAENLMTNLRALERQVEEVNRYGGGSFAFRPSSLTKVVTWEVISAQLQGSAWSSLAETATAQQVTLELTCRPYALLPAWNILEHWDTDTITDGEVNIGGTDWEAFGSATGVVSIANSLYTLTSGARSYIYNGDDTQFYQNSLHTKARISSQGTFGLILKYIDADNYLYASLTHAGVLSLIKRVAGVETTLGTGPVTVTAGKFFYMRAYQNESRVSVGFSQGTQAQNMANGGSVQDTTVSYTLSDAENAIFGESVQGQYGFLANASASHSISMDWLRAKPVYRRSPVSPAEFTVRGLSDYEAAPRADIDIAFYNSCAARGALVGWFPEVRAYNMLQNGEADNATYNWQVGSTWGQVASATSIASNTSEQYDGDAAIEIITGTTANAGATNYAYAEFLRGQTYTAEVFAKCATGATVELVVADGTVTAVSSQVVLTSDYQRISVEYSPTGAPGYIEVGIRRVGTTNETIYVDRLMLYRGTESPLHFIGANTPLGRVAACNYDASLAGADIALTAQPGGNSYYTYLAGATGAITTGEGVIAVPILPWAIKDMGAQNQDVMVTVYGMSYCASTQVSPRATLAAYPLHGQTPGAKRYSTEYGTQGKALAVPTAGGNRMVKLGTIALPANADARSKWILEIELSNGSASTGVLGFDTLILVPTKNHIRTIGGQEIDSERELQAAIVPAAVGDAAVLPEVRIYHDGRKELRIATKRLDDVEWAAAGSVAGAQITLPTEDTTFVVWSGIVGIDSTGDHADDDYSWHTLGSVSVNIQPRTWGLTS